MRNAALVVCGLALASTTAAAQNQWFSLATERANDLMGWSVGAAGDVNKDGIPDFLVGAPFELALAKTPGHAIVYSGRDGSVIWTFRGDVLGDQLGNSVDGIGDIDNDGWDDVLLGAWGHDKNGRSSGQIQVRSGRTGNVLIKIAGEGLNDHFGCSVSRAGDVNKDTWPDFVVGALWDDNRGPDSGSAQVFSGRDGRRLYTFDGDLPGDYLGFCVGGGGDVDADGYDDVIAGAPLHPKNGAAAGMARVFSGKSGAVLWTFYGDGLLDQFGFGVAIAGDVNKDGHADVVVGAPGDDNRGAESGSARVLSGKDGKVLHAFDGEAAGDNFGFSVRAAGDVDGDGYADVIIGAPLGQGSVAKAGYARVHSGKSGAVLWTLRGGAKEDEFGFAVSGVGDLNCDGGGEILVGVRRRDAGGPDTGRARVFSGKRLSLETDVHQLSLARGGGQRLALHAGAQHAGKAFVFVGTVSGTKPGIRLGALHVPINLDPYTLLLLGAPNALVQPSIGMLDANGRALSRFQLPGGLTQLAGLVLDHAYVAVDVGRSTLTLASNAVPLVLTR